MGTGLTAQALRFAGVGALSTVVHLGLFATLRSPVGSAQMANLLALLLATVANTAMNRRWTFGVRGRSHAARQHAQGLAVLGVTLLMTSGALGLLHLSADAAPTWVETTVVALATACSTLVRFVAMRRWIFRPPLGSRLGEREGPVAVLEDDDAGPVEAVDLAVADRHRSLADR